MNALFVDPGDLRHELSLQAFEAVGDGAGGSTGVWVERARLPARVEPVGSDRVFAAGAYSQTATHRVTLRFRPGLAGGMRFEKSGRYFSILTVTDPDETGRYLVCRVSEEQP
jgi:SPP1 family predicted phage head-tail adaptor